MSKYESPFFPEEYYHVFNRAVGDDLLFKNASHNLFFLQRVEKYFLRVADIFCYNLLPNHFHFLLRIKNEMALGKASKELHPGKTLCISHMPDFTLQQFGNAFNSYTKSFNGWENRKGRLFIESLKRCNVKDDKYFLQLVHYIHANPVQHGICDSIESWKHSSYPGLISNTRTFLKRKELLDWFGGLEGFVEYHQQIQPPGFEEPPGLSDLPTM